MGSKSNQSTSPAFIPFSTLLITFRLQTEEGKDEEERGQEGDDDKTPAAGKDGHHHGYIGKACTSKGKETLVLGKVVKYK